MTNIRRNLPGKKPEIGENKKGRKISPSWVSLIFIFSRRLANLYTGGNEVLLYNEQAPRHGLASSPSRAPRLGLADILSNGHTPRLGLPVSGSQTFYPMGRLPVSGSPSRAGRLSIQWATKIHGILQKN